MEKHIEVTEGAGERFYLDFHSKGKVVMLNLLKFKDTADYTEIEALAPEKSITGKEAYQLYMDRVLPELDKAGSKVLFYGNSQHFLIGPEHEKWDAVMLVEHQSAEDFIGFAQNEAYLKNVGHRTAALEDSRLMPILEK